MSRTFIEVPNFTKKWKELRLTDENLRELESILGIVDKLPLKI